MVTVSVRRPRKGTYEVVTSHGDLIVTKPIRSAVTSETTTVYVYPGGALSSSEVSSLLDGTGEWETPPEGDIPSGGRLAHSVRMTLPPWRVTSTSEGGEGGRKNERSLSGLFWLKLLGTPLSSPAARAKMDRRVRSLLVSRS